MMLLKIRSTFRGSLKPLVTVPAPVDYRDKRIDVMEWMAAHGNSTAYDWLKLHEPDIAASFEEPEVAEGAEYRERSTY